jgi:hypothetical protein
MTSNFEVFYYAPILRFSYETVTINHQKCCLKSGFKKVLRSSFSLSLHRRPFICILCISRYTCYKKYQSFFCDLFHTTHTVKTRHVTKIRGRCCGDVEMVTYLVNTPWKQGSVLWGCWGDYLPWRTRRDLYLWCWISVSLTTVSEVALTLVLTDTYITLMT